MTQPLHVGFSGTRENPSIAEQRAIETFIRLLPADTWLITGACVGIDALVARAGAKWGYHHVHTIVPHTPGSTYLDPEWERWCDTYEMMPSSADPYGDRDRQVVRASDILVAFPLFEEHDPRSRRSGTWKTIRIARKQQVPVLLYVLNNHPFGGLNEYDPNGML